MSQDFLIHFNPKPTIQGGSAGDVERQNLKKTCQEFEALFIQQLLSVMRKAVPKSDLLGGRSEEEMYYSMFDQELAVQLAEQRGIGLGDMLYEQLKGGLSADSKTEVQETSDAGLDTAA
jgi:peptidoglycan hydrolase FlgJ